MLSVITGSLMASYAFSARFESAPVYRFLLQGGKEALGDCVVVAVTGRAHAACDAVALKQFAVLPARVLATAVRVLDEPRRRPAPRQGMPKRRQRQVAVERLAKRPADGRGCIIASG